MNKLQWKTYRHNWRSASAIIYDEDSDIPYEKRLKIEAFFKNACVSRATEPSELSTVWEWAKRARQNGAEIEHTRNAVRSYMRMNTKSDGRMETVRNHPCYASQYDTIK